MNVSAVARRHGIAPSLLFRWRREAALKGGESRTAGAAGFLPVRLAASSDNAAPVCGGGGIEITLGGGIRFIVDERSDLALRSI
jgi:hypothetical protein